MTTAQAEARGGMGWFWLLLIVVGLAVLCSLAVEVDMAVEPQVNVPAPAALNAHAMQKHIEAADIYARYQSGQYSCLRVYRQLEKNRILWLFSYPGETLQGGMFTTVSGAPVTAFVAEPAYWQSVIARDGYVLISQVGQCR